MDDFDGMEWNLSIIELLFDVLVLICLSSSGGFFPVTQIGSLQGCRFAHYPIV